jgi:hypothetical protein
MAEILQVSMQTLATWRCKKRGPPSFKLGKKVFYLTAEFTDWMMAQAHQQAEKATKPRKPRARAKTHTPAPPPPRDEDDAQGVLWASS